MIKKSKISHLFIFSVVFIATFAAFVQDTYRQVPNKGFGEGEYFEYKVHYGVFSAAEAQVEVAPQVQVVNGRPCYNVNITGRTVGAFDLITTIRDSWQSWIDTSAIVSQKFQQKIRENSHRREETIVFDHSTNKANVTTKDDGTQTFNVPKNAQDAISGYFYLRTVDYAKLQPGDLIQIPAFFDKKIYNTRVRYRGREVIRTKFGKINAFKINPLMNADNELFKGENAIRIWVSDDVNKVPVKVEVDLWVGSMVMELRKYKGIKHDFKWIH
jgi:Protein of unknown function (DUF3108)